MYPVSDSFKEKYFNPHLVAFRGMYCLKPIRPASVLGFASLPGLLLSYFLLKLLDWKCGFVLKLVLWVSS